MFFATVGVSGFFATVLGWFFATVKGFFYYGKEGYLHQLWFSATVTRVYYIGTGPQRSGASRRLIFVGDCDKQEAAIHCWAPLLGAIAGVPWPGCHDWMIATNLGGVHVGCHCWLPLLT